VGFLAAFLSFVVAVSYVALKVIGVQFPIGNPTIVSLVLLLGGFQLICLGIIGQYIGRIYDEVKRRPRYIVDYLIGMNEHDED
jgi:dolichol-phosphate mannosyltransferase